MLWYSAVSGMNTFFLSFLFIPSSFSSTKGQKILLHVCVCTSVYVHACLGEFTLGVVHVHLRYCSLETIQPFSLFLSLFVWLFDWDKRLSLVWNLSSRPGLLAIKPQGFAYLCLPNTGIISMHHHTWLLFEKKKRFWELNSGPCVCQANTYWSYVVLLWICCILGWY